MRAGFGLFLTMSIALMSVPAIAHIGPSTLLRAPGHITKIEQNEAGIAVATLATSDVLTSLLVCLAGLAILFAAQSQQRVKAAHVTLPQPW